MIHHPSIQISDQILGGTPVFAGTRVPIKTFLDYLEGGYGINEFLEEFPTVKKEQIISVLEVMKKEIIETHHETATR